ncbi:MAG: TadE/TadG family type IV pilus assembly protein, partial [Pseudomonadota bacterium]
MTLKRLIWRFIDETRAAALVEFTLVFPLLLVFLAGLSEFGFAMHQQHILQKAVRDAARYAARSNYALKSCPLSTQPEWTQTVADATTVALRGSLAAS